MTDQNAINKQTEDLLIQKSSGDPFIHYEITGTQDYTLGIDDNDGDKLKLTDGSTPSSGEEILTINPAASNAIKFNNAYEFPTDDGTANYVLGTDGSGTITWRVNAASGKGIQQVRTSTNSNSTTTTIIPYDDTIPQQTEGTEIFTLSITPTNSNNILLFDFFTLYTTAGVVTKPLAIFALFQDTTANALFATADGDIVITPPVGALSFQYYMTAGTTSSTTFKIRYGPSATGNVILNGSAPGSRKFGGVSLTTFIISEITP